MTHKSKIEDLEFVPDATKGQLLGLIDLYGSDWMTDLLNADEPKGDGTSPGLVYEIPLQVDFPASQAVAEDSESEGDIFSKGIGLDFFLQDANFIYEDFFEDAEDSQTVGTESEAIIKVINLWVSTRVKYLRTFENYNTKEARIAAYEQVQAVEIGGEQLFCHSCGSIFWDNLRRLVQAERNFCSIPCQENVEQDCITCGSHYVVGRAKRGWKNLDRLNGFCTPECSTIHRKKQMEDRKYVQGVRKRLEGLGFSADFDEAVTRRAVFDRDQGKCYICGKSTNWNRNGEWDPDLANLDHIDPVSRGGSHTWENVALACQLCNIRKGAKQIE